VAELLAEHAAGRKLVVEMAEELTRYQAGNKNAASDLNKAAKSYAHLLIEHIAKEDRDLYPIADAKISAGDQKEMAEVFEKIEVERIGMETHEKFHAMLGEFKQKYLKD
jgi:hemerythrin-like domain-containing protein